MLVSHRVLQVLCEVATYWCRCDFAKTLGLPMASCPSSRVLPLQEGSRIVNDNQEILEITNNNQEFSKTIDNSAEIPKHVDKNKNTKEINNSQEISKTDP